MLKCLDMTSCLGTRSQNTQHSCILCSKVLRNKDNLKVCSHLKQITLSKIKLLSNYWFDIGAAIIQVQVH